MPFSGFLAPPYEPTALTRILQPSQFSRAAARSANRRHTAFRQKRAMRNLPEKDVYLLHLCNYFSIIHTFMQIRKTVRGGEKARAVTRAASR